MLIARRKATATPVLGTFTEVIPHSVDAILRQIYISPATQTTTFDFEVSDPDGNVFLTQTGQKGRFNENHIDLPTDTTITLVITSASVNEVFTIIFAFET